MGFFWTLWIHIFRNKLSKVKCLWEIYMFIQFLSTPVKSEQLDHQNSRSLKYRKSFTGFLLLLTMFTWIFVISGQSFDFTKLLNALLKVLMMSYVEGKCEKRLKFVRFAVTLKTLDLWSQFASKNLKYQRFFFVLLH